MSNASIGTFTEEIESLKASWRTKSAKHLSNYLVVGYHDPRINLASILGRHYLVDQLNTATADQIKADEIRHAARLNGMLARGDRPSEADLNWPAGAWRDALQSVTGRPLSVLELACGSANDARFLESYGLAAHLDYTGFDLSEDNIRNARALFPSGRFDVGNSMATGYAPSSFDVVMAHDLLEHLSQSAMEATVAEMARLTRMGAFIGFWNVGLQSDHVNVWVDERQYHRNLLSEPKLTELFRRSFRSVRWLHIHDYLRRTYDFDRCYNPLSSVVVLEDPI